MDLYALVVAFICRLMFIAISLTRPMNSIILKRDLLQFMQRHHFNKCVAAYHHLPFHEVLPNSTWHLLLWYAPSNIIGCQYILFYT
jgi:hypothetical protein